jgi:hypothetical protein
MFSKESARYDDPFGKTPCKKSVKAFREQSQWNALSSIYLKTKQKIMADETGNQIKCFFIIRFYYNRQYGLSNVYVDF